MTTLLHIVTAWMLFAQKLINAFSEICVTNVIIRLQKKNNNKLRINQSWKQKYINLCFIFNWFCKRSVLILLCDSDRVFQEYAWNFEKKKIDFHIGVTFLPSKHQIPMFEKNRSSENLFTISIHLLRYCFHQLIQYWNAMATTREIWEVFYLTFWSDIKLKYSKSN